MSTALALVAPSELSQANASVSSERLSAAPVSEPRSRAAKPSFVYGDTTPFPHDWNFIDTIKESVACAVELLRAQDVLIRSGAHESEIERRIALGRARLYATSEAVERTLCFEVKGASEAVTRTAARIIESARQVVEAEVLVLEGAAQAELRAIRDAMLAARAQAARAIEKLLSKHDLPGTRIGFRLVAKEVGYAAEALVSTTIGVNAIFELAIPAADPWSKLRRVADVRPETFLKVPQEAGWFSKRMEITRLTLDRLYILGVSGDGDHGIIILGRAPRAGAGYQLDIDASRDAPRILLAELGDDGDEVARKAIELGGEDRGRVLQLWRRLRESLSDVLPRRSKLASATVDSRPLEAEEPHTVAKRMMDALAPVTVEIAKRSAAPGELALRRNVGSGRRDEVYVTKAELNELVMTLAPPLQKVFEGLELDGPRSPRAPEPSLAAYEEVSAELLEG